MTEKSRVTVILCIFAKKYNQISYRLIVFGKMFVIGQSLKYVHVAYSFHAILIFF